MVEFSRDLLFPKWAFLARPTENLIIPFVNASFSTSLVVFLAFWPLWWILGIEQFLPPFFLAWEMVRHLLWTRGRFFVTSTIWWAFLLAVWWLVPIRWVEREHLDIFLKQVATIWSQVLILLLCWNGLRTEKDWHQAVQGLSLLAVYVALGGLIFVSGLWRGEVLSMIGHTVPVSMRRSSAFFASISYRTFGTIRSEEGFLFQRVSSFALQFSGLSMVVLLLIPLIMWRLHDAQRWRRYGWGGVLLGLLVCLVYAKSRIALLAFVLGAVVSVTLLLDLHRPSNRFLLLALIALTSLLISGTGYLAVNEITQAVRTAILEWRPGSWLVRLQIYRETLRMLPEHPIAGWGLPVRIPEMRSVYSAGSHSSYLGILFQHGAIGLILYLGLWLSIWRRIIRGLRQQAILPSYRVFWVAVAVSMFSFNIREAADSWWWDQLVTMTMWVMWGLIMTAPRFMWGKVNGVG